MRLLIVKVFCLAYAVNGIAQQQQKSPFFRLSNQLSITTEYYSISGSQGRQLPFTYALHGNPVLYIGDNPIPFGFLVSSFSNQFQQPFNQIGVSPKFKWLQIHAGYRNLNFSPYTLGGQRILGAGFEMNPGKFHFGFFYGRIRSAIEPDSASTPIQPGSFFFGPGYRRTGWGARVGVGNLEGTYLGISIFKASDKVGSLDSSFRSLVPVPEANTVIGLTGRIALSKRIQWINEVALSAFTRNTFQDTIALEDIPLGNFLSGLFQPGFSSQYLLAVESNLRYQSPLFQLSIRYRRIDPDFKSMGTYYLLADLQEISLNPGFRIGPKLFIRGSLGLQRDNLREIKQRTTKRIIYQVSADYAPINWFGISGQYSNFGISQSPIAPNIPDSAFIRQVNSMWSIMPRFNFKSEGAYHVIQLQAGGQQLNNEINSIYASSDVSTFNSTLIYSWNHLLSRITVTPSLTLIKVSSEVFETSSTGLSVSLGYPFKKKPVHIQFQSGYFNNRLNDVQNGYTLNLGGNLNYQLSKGIGLIAGLQYMNNKSVEGSILPSFKEWRIRFGFTWNFSTGSGNRAEKK